MIPEEILKGDIREFCIACLTKIADMYNLNEEVERRSMFTTVFSVELDKGVFPQYICSVCDVKLKATYDFQEAVRKCLDVLQEYDILTVKSAVKVKEELLIDEDYNESNDESGSEDESIMPDKKVHQQGGIKIESPDEVDRVVEEFKNQQYQHKTCVLCGFIAGNRRSMSSHMAIGHKESKDNWCLECNKIFENFDEHKQTHTGKYSCPFCDKESHPSHYIEHLQSHSGNFSCTICNKSFRSAAWLKKHNRIHTNDKPFTCPNCGKSFIQLSSLRYHVGTHGKLPCNSCKKRYRTAEELDEHECDAMESLPATEVWIKSDDGEYQSEDVAETIVIKGSEPLCSVKMSDSDVECTPSELQDGEEMAGKNLLPQKSKSRYEKAYRAYMDWCDGQGVQNVTTESIVIAYFCEMAKEKKASTLWATYSMLRSTLLIKDKVDISKYINLLAYLKKENSGYKPKKSSVFTEKDIEKFLNEAPMDYLPLKVALIIGICGACRTDELFKMKTMDIDFLENKVSVLIPDRKKYHTRAFVITNKEWITVLKQYVDLRKHVENERFFLQWKLGKATKQPLGHNAIAMFPKKIAAYLKLNKGDPYTGHCFRRTAATLLANSKDVLRVKGLTGRRSSPVTASYIDGCFSQVKIESISPTPDVHVQSSSMACSSTSMQ